MLTEELYYKTEKTSSKKEKKGTCTFCVLSHLFLGGPAAINVMCPPENRLSPIKKKEKGEWGDTDIKSWLIPNNT